ncbi:MAG: DNA recombination protein RmuC [Bacteroidota bacterium]
MEIVFLLSGCLLGFAIGYLFIQFKIKQQAIKFAENQAILGKEYLFKIAEATKLQAIAENNLARLEEQYNNRVEDLKKETQKNSELHSRIATLDAEYKNLLEKLTTQKQELDELQKKFTTEFENLAHKIFKEHSLEFATVNQKNIGDILLPLKEKIQQFEKKVEETHEKGVRDNVSLREEVKKLYDLNSKISEEANNLTKALKGENKSQGNWGEMVLERVLERSGLVKGAEYEVQMTMENVHHDTIRPDVIVKLPDNKHIVIDSKVSLVSYEKYINSEDKEEKDAIIKLHNKSIRSHVEALSNKAYETGNLIHTSDFVLLFMPIEAAFSLAVQYDLELFNYAWDRKIVIVSPTTLLATLRTIASMWKTEKQNRNALEIAELGGSLYDKLQGFLTDYERLGEQINKLQNTYSDGQKKISTGSGNLVSKVEKMKQLGSKATKSIPEKFLLDEENTIF